MLHNAPLYSFTLIVKFCCLGCFCVVEFLGRDSADIIHKCFFKVFVVPNRLFTAKTTTRLIALQIGAGAFVAIAHGTATICATGYSAKQVAFILAFASPAIIAPCGSG